MSFDYNFYVQKYPDCAKMNYIDACNHFLTHGINEKRQFCSSLEHFEYDCYIQYNKNCANKNYLDACSHFLQHFVMEKCCFNFKLKYFDYDFYKIYYSDCKDLNYKDACIHFLQDGIKQQRIFSPNLKYFDYNFYKKHYTDCAKLSWFDASTHFLMHGIKEQRIFSPNLVYFDYNFYKKYYTDCAKLSWFDTCTHFISYGIPERRLISPLLKHLNIKYYKSKDQNLKGATFLDTCVHFLEFGISEKRLFCSQIEHLDEEYYKQRYADCAEMSWYDTCVHFLEFGISEKRLFCSQIEHLDEEYYKQRYADCAEMSWYDICIHFLQNEDPHKTLQIILPTHVPLPNEGIKILHNNYDDNEVIQSYKFIHITKTGGTSIEEFGIQLNLRYGRFDSLFNKRFGYWHQPAYFISKRNRNRYNWFTVVRNPYNRIISEVNFLILSGHLTMLDIKFMNIYLQNLLESIYKEDKLDIEFLESDKLMFKFHFVPQHYYTHVGDKMLNNLKILRFENLVKDVNDFFISIGVKETFDVHSQINEKKVFKLEDISKQNIELINRIYDCDFKLFGYNKLN